MIKTIKGTLFITGMMLFMMWGLAMFFYPLTLSSWDNFNDLEKIGNVLWGLSYVVFAGHQYGKAL